MIRSNAERTSVLLSVKPKFARALIAGTKTIEVRRRFPSLETGTAVFVYSSAPDSAIIGVLAACRVFTAPSTSLFDTHGSFLDASQEELDSYLRGTRDARLLEVSKGQPMNSPISLRTLRRMGIDAPQSYRWLSRGATIALRREGWPESAAHHNAAPEVTST